MQVDPLHFIKNIKAVEMLRALGRSAAYGLSNREEKNILISLLQNILAKEEQHWLSALPVMICGTSQLEAHVQTEYFFQPLTLPRYIQPSLELYLLILGIKINVIINNIC